MKLPESILRTMYEMERRKELLEISIFCEESKRDEIACFFNETMKKYWIEAEKQVEEKYSCNNEDNNYAPTDAFSSDGKVMVYFISRPVFYKSEDCSDVISEEANAVIEKTLVKLLREYPEVSVEGYMGFCFEIGNEKKVYQYELTSKGTGICYDETDRVYDFVGESIAETMRNYFFWKILANQLEKVCGYTKKEEIENVLKFIEAYSKWLPEDSDSRLFKWASIK